MKMRAKGQRRRQQTSLQEPEDSEYESREISIACTGSATQQHPGEAQPLLSERKHEKSPRHDAQCAWHSHNRNAFDEIPEHHCCDIFNGKSSCSSEENEMMKRTKRSRRPANPSCSFSSELGTHMRSRTKMKEQKAMLKQRRCCGIPMPGMLTSYFYKPFTQRGRSKIENPLLISSQSNMSQEQSPTLWQWLTISWMTPYLYRLRDRLLALEQLEDHALSKRRTAVLSINELPEIFASDKVEEWSRRFLASLPDSKTPAQSRIPRPILRIWSALRSHSFTDHNGYESIPDKKATEQLAVLYGLFRTVTPSMGMILAMKLVMLGFNLASPLLLGQLLSLSSAPANQEGGAAASNSQFNEKLVQFGWLLVVNLISIFLGTQYGLLVTRINLRIKSGLVSASYCRTILSTRTSHTGRTFRREKRNGVPDALEGGATVHRSGSEGDASENRDKDSNTTERQKEEGREGSIYNLILFDVEGVISLMMLFIDLIIFPFTFFSTLRLLYGQVGTACLAGLLVLLILVGLLGVLRYVHAQLRYELMHYKDQRVHRIVNVLARIPSIIMMGWRDVAAKYVKESREKEVRAQYKRKVLQAWSDCISYVTGTLVTLATLWYVVALDEAIPAEEGTSREQGRTLSISQILPTVQLVSQLIGPLMIFPSCIGTITEGMICYRRMVAFLLTSEGIEEEEAEVIKIRSEIHVNVAKQDGAHSAVQRSRGFKDSNLADRMHTDGDKISPDCESTSTPILSLEDAIFAWSPSDTLNSKEQKGFQLGPLSMSLDENQIMVVVGSTGSGKTSLLKALLGEMPLISGCLDWPNYCAAGKEYPGGLCTLDERRQNKKGLLDLQGNELHDCREKRRAKGGDANVPSPRISSEESEEESSELLIATHLRIAYASQKLWIPRGTIRDIITFDRPYSPHSMRSALKIASLSREVDYFLKDADLTEILYGGVNLSSGQRQRLCLARAFYQDPSAPVGTSLILLDDPFSNLDRSVAAEVWDAAVAAVKNAKRRNKTSVSPAMVVVIPEDVHNIILSDPRVDHMFSLTKGCLKRLQSNPHPKRFKASSLQDTREDQNEELQSPAPEELGVSKIADASGVKSDRQNYGAVRWKYYQIYGAFVGHKNLWLIAISVIGIIVFQRGIDYWIGTAVSQEDVGAGGGVDRRTTLHYTLAIYSIAVLLFILCNIAGFVLEAIAGLRAAIALHERLLSAVLLRAGFTWHLTVSTGGNSESGGKSSEEERQGEESQLVNRFNGDQWVIDETITRIYGMLLGAIVLLLGTIGFLSLLAQTFLVMITVFPILGFVIYKFLAQYFRTAARELQRLMLESRSPLYRHFEESISGRETIRAFGCERQYQKEHMRLLSRYQRVNYAQACTNIWLDFRLQLIGFILTACNASLPVLMMVSTSSPSPQSKIGSPVALPSPSSTATFAATMGVIGFAITYSQQLSGILSGIITYFTSLETEMVSVERFENVVEDIGDSAVHKQAIATHLGTSLAHQPARIRFENVTVVYPKGSRTFPALRNISFNISPGSKLLIQGRTGAGKSSLLLALLGLLPIQKGKIYWDEVEVSKVEEGESSVFCSARSSRCSPVAVLPPQPVILEDLTVRTNLDPYSEYRDDQLRHVLGLVGLLHLLDNNYSGLETIIAGAQEIVMQEEPGNMEQGKTATKIVNGPSQVEELSTTAIEQHISLSAGQAQLVSIARILLRALPSATSPVPALPALLVMDEIGSCLPTETEEKILSTIFSLFKDCTTVIVSHRSSARKYATMRLQVHEGQAKLL